LADPNADEQFISEPIEPEAGSFDAAQMSSGLASLPAAFTWRGRRYAIVECLDHVKQSSPEGGTAGGERYLRRQSFTVLLDTGQTARIYVERHARPGASRKTAKRRWFLYTITSGDMKDG
jgi:hypothetical protein